MGFHEVVAADETARFLGYAQELSAVQAARAARGGGVSRALHVKQHVGVVGELRVTVSALAPAGAAGVFANSGHTYPLYARFSNGASRPQRDKLPDVRGFSLKLVGVPGRKIIPGLEEAQTQDFLFIDQAAIPFRDPDEFMIFQRAAKDGPLKLLPRMLGGFGLKRTLGVFKHLAKSAPVSSFATHEFHTAAPISFGETAAKLSLIPLAPPAAAETKGADMLRGDLVARLRSGPLHWSVVAQLFVDDVSTPIEDTSVTWVGPSLQLGVLTVHKQDVTTARGQEIDALVERLSFDPWHAVEAHRPLGAIMRARGVAYRESVIRRRAAPEPDSLLPL
jgi:hypothetical protein